MPHFFFHSRDDGHHVADEEGVELPDVQAAKALAVRALTDLARDACRHSHERHIAVDVLDAGGKLLLTTEISYRARFPDAG